MCLNINIRPFVFLLSKFCLLWKLVNFTLYSTSPMAKDITYIHIYICILYVLIVFSCDEKDSDIFKDTEINQTSLLSSNGTVVLVNHTGYEPVGRWNCKCPNTVCIYAYAFTILYNPQFFTTKPFFPPCHIETLI